MSALPVDIWWIILKMVWKDNIYGFQPREHKDITNPFPSKIPNYTKKFGDWVTNDLYIMRTLCKTTKKMVDKYSKRYIRDSYYDENPRYFLIFPYE